MKLKERFYRFMYGRYGNDAFGQFITYLNLALIIINLFIRSYALSVLISALFVIWFFRVFSRNTQKRYLENSKYLSIKKKFLQFFKLIGNRIKYRKTHVYRKCPTCGSMLKLPKIKGSHTVNCPNCAKSFDVKI